MTCWGDVRWNNDVAADDTWAVKSGSICANTDLNSDYNQTILLSSANRWGLHIQNPISKKATESGKAKQMIVNSKFIYMQTFSHKTKFATANTFCHSVTFIFILQHFEHKKWADALKFMQWSIS